MRKKDKRENILVVNDDGITSSGMSELVKALGECGNVFVCAPVSQRSGYSQSITLGGQIFVNKVEYPGTVIAYEVDGTPADCTKVGLQFLEEEGYPVDIVYSGINHGGNMGKDTLYSGTVGAAMEAAVSGVPAVAVSVDSHNASHFDVACELAVRILPKALAMSSDIITNINVPNLPRDKIKGVRITALGSRYYLDRFYRQQGGGYMLDGVIADLTDPEKRYDITAIQDHYASITPLQFDYTMYEAIDDMREWDIDGYFQTQTE